MNDAQPELLDDILIALERRAAALRREPGITLATTADLFQLAITFGAPLYNAGHEEMCLRLYREAARRLSDTAELVPDALPPRTAAIIDDVWRALQRADEIEDAGDSAWALRHAFDKVMLTYQATAEHLRALVNLGEAAFARGDYGGSVDVLRSATDCARDLLAREPEDSDHIQIAHLAFIFLGHSLLGVGAHRAAADALRTGLRLVPRWAEVKFDLSDYIDESPQLRQHVDELETLRTLHGDDEQLEFLAGYIAFFTGHKHRAARYFERLSVSNPDDDEAHLLRAYSASEHQRPN